MIAKLYLAWLLFFLLFLQVSTPSNLPAEEFSGGKFTTLFGLGNRISRVGNEILKPYKRDGKLYLALTDCIYIASKRNLDIHLQEEAIAQADADVTKAWTAMLPFVGGEANYTRLDEELALGLGPVSMTFMEQDISKVGVVLKQPIFAGGRLDAARKAARHLRDSRLFDKETVEKEVLFQVTRVYRTAQVAEAFNKVAVEAVDLLKQHEHDVNILVREGAIPEVDLLRTQTELANAVKDLNVTSNAFDIALSSLKNLLVIDLETPVVLTLILRRLARPGESLENLTIQAIENRSELAALKMRVGAAEQGLIAARGKYLPSIALEAHYDYMKGNTRELDGDDHWTIGVGGEVPLWNWGETRAGVIKATSILKQTEIEYKKTEEAICLQVRKAFLNLGKSEKNITAAASALKTSKEGFRLERARYHAGEGINTDVLDARTALSRAEANHLQALFEYNIALADMERAVGIRSITESNNIIREQAQ